MGAAFKDIYVDRIHDIDNALSRCTYFNAISTDEMDIPLGLVIRYHLSKAKHSAIQDILANVSRTIRTETENFNPWKESTGKWYRNFGARTHNVSDVWIKLISAKACLGEGFCFLRGKLQKQLRLNEVRVRLRPLRGSLASLDICVH